MDRDNSRRSSCTKLTEKQVAAAVARHELLYSGRVGGARAVFAFSDLFGLDLSGRNLADADFTGAYLEKTNLAGARLDSTSFFGASLKRANLTGASLRRADMRGAKLRATDFRGTILQGIKLSLDAAVEAIFDETRFDSSAVG
ncbi:MAG: pentapeptide repeat-containing protein [Alphaproteobacteria bacterium]|nr:pentapeptide repeat-containing protein [Alphaproteobacteria bacterium]